MKVVLKNVRLSFPELFKAKAVSDGDKPAFSVTAIFPPDSPNVAALNEAFKTAATEKWASKAPDVLKALKAGDKTALHDGDAKAYDGFAGNLYVGARNAKRPQVRDRDGTTPLIEEDGKIYAGCYANVIVDIWAQDNKYGKRLNASLLGVQFLRDGDPLAGGSTAEESDFEAIEDDFDDLI